MPKNGRTMGMFSWFDICLGQDFFAYVAITSFALLFFEEFQAQASVQFDIHDAQVERSLKQHYTKLEPFSMRQLQRQLQVLQRYGLKVA